MAESRSTSNAVVGVADIVDSKAGRCLSPPYGISNLYCFLCNKQNNRFIKLFGFAPLPLKTFVGISAPCCPLMEQILYTPMMLSFGLLYFD